MMRLLNFIIAMTKSGTRKSCTEIALPRRMFFSIIYYSHSQVTWSGLLHEWNITEKCRLLFWDNFLLFWFDQDEFRSQAYSSPESSPDPVIGHGTSYFLNNLDTPVINLKLVFILLIKENNILEFIRICFTEFTLSLEVSYPLF